MFQLTLKKKKGIRQISLQSEDCLYQYILLYRKVELVFTDLQFIKIYKLRLLCRMVNVRGIKLLLYAVSNHSA